MDLLSDTSSSTVVDVVVALLLILLLVERELMRAAGQRWQRPAQALNVAAVSVLSAFVVVLATRLAALL